MQVTDNECSFVKERDSRNMPKENNIESQIDQLVQSWKQETKGEEYNVATTCLLYLHRLTQVYGELSKAVEFYPDHQDIYAMNEEVLKLRVDIIRNHDESFVENTMIRYEEINIKF